MLPPYPTLQCNSTFSLQCFSPTASPPYSFSTLPCSVIFFSPQCDLLSASSPTASPPYSVSTYSASVIPCSVILFLACSVILFQPTVSPRCSASTLQCIAPTLKCEFISTLQCDLVPTLQSGLCHYVVQYGTEIRRTAVFIRFSTVYTVKYGTAYSTVQTLKASINWALFQLCKWLSKPTLFRRLLLNLAHLKACCRGVCRGPQQALGVRQAGLPQSLPLPLLCWASIHLCFIPWL